MFIEAAREDAARWVGSNPGLGLNDLTEMISHPFRRTWLNAHISKANLAHKNNLLVPLDWGGVSGQQWTSGRTTN